MLRAEFALDVPGAQATLNAWLARPDTVPSALPDMLSFLDRSAEFVQVVGMQGFSAFLQQIRSFANMVSQPNVVFSPRHAPNFTQLASVKWLASWPEKLLLI